MKCQSCSSNEERKMEAKQREWQGKGLQERCAERTLPGKSTLMAALKHGRKEMREGKIATVERERETEWNVNIFSDTWDKQRRQGNGKEGIYRAEERERRRKRRKEGEKGKCDSWRWCGARTGLESRQGEARQRW